MAKQNDPLVIPYFSTGLYTHRSQLFSPSRSVGVNVVSYHDAVIDGQDMELTTLMQWTRRPGFSRFCSQQLGVTEIPLQFYSVRQPSGNVVPFVDTNQHFSTFSPSAITPLVNKTTPAQGYVQQIGQTTYYTDGVDQVKWNGATVTNWGIQGPLQAPVLAQTGNGEFWQPMFTTPAHYIVLDYNGNFQEVTTTGVTGVSVPLWNTTFGGVTIDNTVNWSNHGPYAGWMPTTPYLLGTVISDTNGNLQEVTTAGTSGAAAPTFANVIGNTTVDGGVTWTLRGLGFVNPVTPAGPNYPTTVAQLSSGVNVTPWTNIAKVEAADGVGAQVGFPTANPNSQFLVATGYGFAVAGTITGVLVEIGMKGVYSKYDGLIQWQLVNGGVTIGTSGGSPGPLTGVYQNFPSGGSSYLWGTALTPAIVNSPTFGVQVWASSSHSTDNVNVDYIRLTVYATSASPTTLGSGQISAQAGYSYVACYHTLSGHVSTASPATPNTGTILGQFANSLSVPASPDPQCDQVQFYRPADGGGIYYLLGSVANPGTGTVTFVDNANPDSNLQNTIIAPLNHLNDPPPAGMTILAYWQGRMWGAVENLLYFNAGPDCINGVPEESWPPANVFQYSGPIIGLIKTSQGLLVWGSDYVGMALGGPQTLSFYPWDLLQNFGISSPNCIDQDGDTISILSTAGQCWLIDMSGKSETGNWITEVINATFAPNTSYIAYHRQGQDSALWMSDGSVNALRFGLNIQAWSTEYKPVGGIGAINSIETSTGVQSLCAGRPTGGGYILARNQSTWQDDGQNYTNCSVTVGSIVLSQLGAPLAPVQHVVLYCDAAGTGVSGPTVPAVAILPNEIAANAPAAFLMLTNPVSEYTTGTAQSSSLLALRWPVDSMNSTVQSQLMHHLQVKITFPPENAPNSIKAMALMFNKNG